MLLHNVNRQIVSDTKSQIFKYVVKERQFFGQKTFLCHEDNSILILDTEIVPLEAIKVAKCDFNTSSCRNSNYFVNFIVNIT
jgi:hypothetical protein